MARRVVDLSAHLNQTVERGHPADFPVTLKPLLFRNVDGDLVPVPDRHAVVRTDLGRAIAVVSERYRLVPHQHVLDLFTGAIGTLDMGPVPRGLYVDRHGARMRALYKFPALAEPLVPGDDLCPCLKLENTYDGTGRISVQIGAFRFVCTNLAVGGGGVFAGGFMALHVGTIPLAEAATQLTSFLRGFGRIMGLYRRWRETAFDKSAFFAALPELPKTVRAGLFQVIEQKGGATVWTSYSAATWYATHSMRSANRAFHLLQVLNRTFQQEFPVGAS